MIASEERAESETPMLEPIPLIRPYITAEVEEKVCAVLRSGYLTDGPVTPEFEGQIKAFVGGHCPSLRRFNYADHFAFSVN